MLRGGAAVGRCRSPARVSTAALAFAQPHDNTLTPMERQAAMDCSARVRRALQRDGAFDASERGDWHAAAELVAQAGRLG